MEYALTDTWALLLRTPYDIKEQTAEIGFLGTVPPDEGEAITRNRDIHHRTETYKGLSDLMLLGTHRRRDIFREGDFFRFSAGSTLPVGKTEEDPYELGDHGLEHLHIQFGTGTFDPLLEANYRMTLPRQFSLGAFGLGRLPFYENRKTYRGPIEVSSGVTLNYHWKPGLTLHGNTTVHYQSFAYWKGERDLNSGLVTAGGLFGAAIRAGESTILGFDLRVPFSQKTLAEGDAFKQGLTLLFRISRDL